MKKQPVLHARYVILSVSHVPCFNEVLISTSSVCKVKSVESDLTSTTRGQPLYSGIFEFVLYDLPVP